MNSLTAMTPLCCRRSERCSHRIRFHLTVRTDVAPKFELPNCTLRLKRSWAKVFHPADMAQTLEFHTAFRNVSPRRPAWNSNIQRWHTNQTPPFNYGTVPPLFLGRFDTWVFFFLDYTMEGNWAQVRASVYNSKKNVQILPPTLVYLLYLFTSCALFLPFRLNRIPCYNLILTSQIDRVIIITTQYLSFLQIQLFTLP